MVNISMIICTRNRSLQLRQCLEAVGRITYAHDWELIVVDNASNDTTKAVIEAFAETVKFPVVYTFQPVPGLSNARNAGVAASRGASIMFTDDDCYPQADILSALHDVFNDAQIGFASGRILLHDPTDFPTTINESTIALRFAAKSFLPAGAVKGANLAFRRRVLDQIGPFDPLFGSGAFFPSEDADAAMRASLSGWDGVYAPQMVVSHHHGRKAAEAKKLFKSYDLGRGAYHAKLLTLPGGVLHGIKAWAGLPLRMRHRPSMLYWELKGGIGYWREKIKMKSVTTR
jgi:glycosyltransferase involved in cell wall biosynthesis